MGKNSDRCPMAAPVCEKIYKAVTVNPAFQAIRRISSRPQEPRPASAAPNSSSSTLSVKIVDMQSHTDPPKRRKSAEGAQSHNTLRRTEAAAAAVAVPVNFDHSSYQPPPPNGIPKSATQLSSVPNKTNHQVASKAEPEAKTSTMAVAQSPAKGNKASPKVESPQDNNKEEGKISGLHIEDRFTDYIKRVKIKIRSFSNVGDHDRDHDHDHKHASRKDNKFTDYINRAKAKLRKTSSIGGGERSTSFK